MSDRKNKFTVEFGWGAAPLAKQFPACAGTEKLAAFQKDSEALTWLSIRRILSTQETQKAAKRLTKAIYAFVVTEERRVEATLQSTPAKRREKTGHE